MAIDFIPRTPQKLAIEFLLKHDRCNLFASMGIGKTVSVATVIDVRQQALGEDRPALVMAPLNVARLTWPDDIRKWSHLSHIETVQIMGNPKQRLAALDELAKGNTQIALTNYEQLPWLVDYFKKTRNWPFGIHVADESTRIRGYRLRGQGTQRAGAIGKVAHLKYTKWINATGTPSPRSYECLWGQQWFIDQGERLGRTFTDFHNRWFRQVPGSQFHETEIMPHAAKEIEALIADVTLVLKAEEFFDLPPVTHNRILVELSDRARGLYKQMTKEFFAELESKTVSAESASARSMKLRQLASGSLYHDEGWEWVHDAKVEGLRSVVNEAGGTPVLVAYQFKADLQRLLKAFPEGCALGHSEDTKVRWNAGEIPILFVHPRSAGHGLNLQYGSNILCFYSLDFDLETFLQVIERIGPVRQMQAGLHRPVIIHYLLAANTLDEHVLDVLIGKKTMQEAFLDALIEYRNGK
ncbi:MAG: SNF2-related protein [Anaerolineaceae bacterium]|nr:SNF2-related protein [Anaerolineaceae bacterium]